MGSGVTPAVCRHCAVKKVNRPRGLCWPCYYTPGVKDQYGPPDPATAKYAARGIGDTGGGQPLPAEPTGFPPGSPGKAAVLEARAARGEQLWHPDDSRGINPGVRPVSTGRHNVGADSGPRVYPSPAGVPQPDGPDFQEVGLAWGWG